MAVSEKFEKLVRTPSFIAVFSYRFKETGENTRAVREVTDFPDSPCIQHGKRVNLHI